MKKPVRDPIREERIRNEAIVDAGPEEQAMSWYYYLERKISFPFQARCVVAKVISPLRKGETVDVRGLAAEDACASDMLVQIRWQGGRWPFLSRNWPPSIRTNQPRKLSATGITGSRRAAFSEFMSPTDKSLASE
jgi:hypothetical protein